MRHTIIGTAGHVDHGKTTFIRALTGRETDRLKEEKKRGITIELGFAWLDLPDGGKAGIVDVPGHEKFVGNMLAGAGGIDLVMLIIAADEGVMRQTREHLDILRLLEVKHGLVVMTKADLVEEDWLELAMEDVRETCKGTFLEDAPIFAVDSLSGRGVEEVRAKLCEMIRSLPEKNEFAPYRQPVDRVFSMEGFGTVITGTALSGKVSVGDILYFYPSEEEVRVRSIQVHGEDVQTAYAGQRTAINLAQIAKSDVARGDVLAAPRSMDISQMLDVRVDVLRDSPYAVKSGSRVHFHHGAMEKLCRIRVLEAEELAPGETGMARLMFDEPVAVQFGDHFVLRFYSPVITVGGGIVLDPCPATVKIRDSEWKERLGRIERGTPQDRLEIAVSSASPHFYSLDSCLRRSGLSPLPAEEQERIRKEVQASGGIIPLNEQIWISKDFLEKIRKRAVSLLSEYHGKEPLKAGIRREEMRTRLLPEVRIELSDRLLDLLAEGGALAVKNGIISLPGFSVQLTPEQEQMSKAMEEQYLKAAYAPPETSAVLAQFAPQKRPEAVLADLLDRGVLIRLDANINLHHQFYESARNFVIDTIRAQGELKLADFRDHIESSRKYAVALLDAFDREKLTVMNGDVRVLVKDRA